MRKKPHPYSPWISICKHRWVHTDALPQILAGPGKWCVVWGFLVLLDFFFPSSWLKQLQGRAPGARAKSGPGNVRCPLWAAGIAWAGGEERTAPG